jgi:hypothetical protein
MLYSTTENCVFISNLQSEEQRQGVDSEGVEQDERLRILP